MWYAGGQRVTLNPLSPWHTEGGMQSRQLVAGAAESIGLVNQYGFHSDRQRLGKLMLSLLLCSPRWEEEAPVCCDFHLRFTARLETAGDGWPSARLLETAQEGNVRGVSFLHERRSECPACDETRAGVKVEVELSELHNARL